MIKTMIQMLRISTSIITNQFIYYFKRIPLLGKILPDRSYSFGDIKTFIAVVVAVFKVLINLLGKAAYVAVMLVLPIYFEIPKELMPGLFVNELFFLSMLFGPIAKAVIPRNTMNRYVCIKLMKMPANRYACTRMLLTHAGDGLLFLPCICVAGVFCGIPVWQGCLLTALVFVFRILMEGAFLYVFRKTKRNLAVNMPFQWIMIILCLAGAYLPVLLKTSVFTNTILLHFAVVILLLVAGAACLRYLLRYRDYSQITNATINLDQLTMTNAKAIAKTRFADVTLKEKDFTPEAVISKKAESKKGYQYLNEIFFQRHSRMLVKPVLIRLAVILAVFVGGILFVLIKPTLAAEIGQGLIHMLPAFVFVMYFISLTGERICRAMFNNCDISLLRYSYYRDKNVILTNFKIRLIKILKVNLIPAVAICLSLFIFVTAAGIDWPLNEMLPFNLSILCLSVFFSVHHLFLYYVFQPYTSDLNMKNPLFNIINSVVYLACFVCLQIDSVPKSFALIVLAATTLYIAVALLLVYRFAPKNFRVK